MIVRILAWPTAQNLIRWIWPPAGPLMSPGPENLKGELSLADIDESP
jgi:hypothetical protein